jgi:hypothetical protein
MIRRLANVRLRLIDAVALAAIAVLALKIVGLLAAPPVRAPSGSNGPGEQISGFFRAVANAHELRSAGRDDDRSGAGQEGGGHEA